VSKRGGRWNANLRTAKSLHHQSLHFFLRFLRAFVLRFLRFNLAQAYTRGSAPQDGEQDGHTSCLTQKMLSAN
jgi:hypothetical protein